MAVSGRGGLGVDIWGGGVVSGSGGLCCGLMESGAQLYNIVQDQLPHMACGVDGGDCGGGREAVGYRGSRLVLQWGAGQAGVGGGRAGVGRLGPGRWAGGGT